MNTKTLVVLASVFLCAVSAHAELVFRGYMITTAQPLFVLSAGTDVTSGWLALGQKFAGTSIVAFDAQGERLTVESDGKRQVLPLFKGEIQVADGESNHSEAEPIAISIGQDEAIFAGGAPASLGALRDRFALAAAKQPQPRVTIRSRSNARADQIRAVIDLCTRCGIKRIWVRSQ